MILETFEGYVERVDGDTAYFTLQSAEYNDVLEGECPVSKLLKKGIIEQSRFICRTIEENGVIRIELEPIPDIEVTDEEAQAIEKEMKEAFPDNTEIEY